MFRFRRGQEPTTPNHELHGDHHCHSENPHDHDEVQEALKMAETKSGRKKLLFGGVGNTALMGFAAWAASKGQADPTWIEAAHNVGDVGFYMIPWLASMQRHIHSAGAIKCMRATSCGAAALAASSAIHSTYEAIAKGSVHPEFFTIPSQAALAVGNYAIARYVDKDPNSSEVEEAARRHAWADARTSGYAAVANIAAFAFAPMNAIGAIFVARETIKVERINIKSTTAALNEIKNHEQV